MCDVLSAFGYKITRHAYGLKTAFQAEFGKGGAVIAYNAEYDALPDIGHACGHNLIATSSLAAFLGTARYLEDNLIPGRVRLIGTPAEEDGGGKIDLINAGAYADVDACLMGHPGPADQGGGWNNVVMPRVMARSIAKVTFKGINAHAGNAPWLGKNALDAAVAAFTNLAMLRQQTPPNQRLHAIISKGGDRPNIIPHLTELSLYARAETSEALEKTCKRVIECCEGAATAAGCSVEFHWANSYKELRCSESIASRFRECAASQGQTYEWSSPGVSGASTDQGLSPHPYEFRHSLSKDFYFQETLVTRYPACTLGSEYLSKMPRSVRITLVSSMLLASRMDSMLP